MTDSIAHRGPDDHGYVGVDPDGKVHTWKRPGEKNVKLIIGMGFRRLSIIDLSEGGAQPMTVPHTNDWITFNGEIYNYVELRKELPNVSFRGTSDTEVLLHLLHKQGIEALAKLNGIFAFALLDARSKKMSLVRDHFGVKPLYYSNDNSTLFYGSEIRPILVAKGTPRLNRGLVARYLMCNWVPDPDTLFEGIYRLPPGHRLEIDSDRRITQTSYWDFDLSREDDLPLSDSLGKLDQVLDGAVERQLRADVPIAFFLSGGIDSSLLTVKAHDVAKYPTTAYTIGFDWSHSKDDTLDLESARALAKKIPFKHKEIILSPSIVNLLPKVVETLEEPISDPAAICSYLICEAAKNEFKVLVSGQGGDEMFGGYSLFQNVLLTAQTQKLPAPMISALNMTAKMLPYSVGGKRIQQVHRLKKFLEVASSDWPEALFHLRTSMANIALSEVLDDRMFDEQSDPYARHEEIHQRAADWDVLRQALYLDTKTYLPALNLFYTDKTSMANSVEVRVPFLDLEVARFAERLPNKFKVQGKETKVLLKRLAEKYLPREVTHRKKTGFGLPVRDWLLKDLQPMAKDLFSAERLFAQKIFKPQTLERLLKEHSEKTADHSAKIYNLMTFQLWLDKFGVQV